jgi:phosphate butyryltransferase
MIYRNFDQLIEQVYAGGNEKKTVAVMAPEDSHTLEAVCQAARAGAVEPLLIGKESVMRGQLEAMNENPADYTLVPADTTEEVVVKAARFVADGRAHFLMKGLLHTGDMMKHLLGDQCRFRTDRQMSHLGLVHIPNYHKLVGITDSALNVYPNLEQKKAMVTNAVEAMLNMGFDTPKVAVLAAVEQVNPKMPETLDAANLKAMNASGEIRDCVVEGPISYDLAISRESAELKGYESPVCGDVDLLVAPNIVAANILIKALRYSASASSAGIVVGGRVPLVLTSRAAEAGSKYLPMLLAAVASNGPRDRR